MNDIQWTQKALKQALKIDRKMQPTVRQEIKKLVNWPDCQNVIKLSGREGFRLRVGRYRVIFRVIKGNPIIIKIEEVKKRDERTY